MKTLKLSRLARNEGPPTTNKAVHQQLACNILPKIVRHDTMEGRDFLVVPSVILIEGVHKGSEGPLFYPKEELEKTPAVWNHKPVVVYHPEINGVGVSACAPDILTSRKIGVMMNTRFEKGKLKTEVWLEKDRANTVDERIMAALEKNEMMELSTGVFVDSEQTQGEWNGEDYVGIARNYRPDHLAILPDKIGACSINDGAGFLRNEAGGKQGAIFKAFQVYLQRIGLADNQMSHSNISSQLNNALRKKVGDNTYTWICDVYDDFFIYEMESKLYRLGYSATDTDVTLSDDKPVEVKRVTEYRTVEGAFVGNRDQQTKKQDKNMDKKKLVDAIILAAAASAGSWSEADREPLMAMDQRHLEMIHNTLKKEPAAPPKAEPKTEPKTEPATNTQPAPAAAAAPKVVTLEEYIQNAPAQMREVLRNGIDAYSEEKGKLVEGILANKSCAFTKEELENLPLGNLRKLARLAGTETPAAPRAANYGGQGLVPTGNAEVEEAMEVPVLNFAAK